MAVANGGFKLAQDLRREDTIVTFDFEKQMQVDEKIKSIMIEPVEGYAAPLTMSGTILVDGILASCYASIESQTIAHTVMAPVRWWYSIHGMIDQAAPESFSSHLEIGKQMNGTHWYPAMLESFTQQYLSKLIKLH
jgi:hedgehog protein